MQTKKWVTKIRLILLGWAIHVAIVFIAVIGFNFFTHNHAGLSLGSFVAKQFAKTTDVFVGVVFLLLVEMVYHLPLGKWRSLWMAVIAFIIGCVPQVLLYWLVPERFTYRNVVTVSESIFFTGIYALLYSLMRDYLRLLFIKKEMALQQSINQLDALKAQLNPHFLFNSLNYLYGTALKEQASQTAEGIGQLADMMRYTVHGIQENFVPLTNELHFTRNYLAMQCARLPLTKHIHVTTYVVDTDNTTDNLLIAPLLLLPFIENAFKYGITMDEDCFVTIRIELHEKVLTLYTVNSINHRLSTHSGTNTGTSNAIQRLKLLYPDKYSLNQKQTGGEYSVQLTILM